MAPWQDVRFCTAADGTRIAVASIGSGPPLLRAAHWLSHVEHDFESPSGGRGSRRCRGATPYVRSSRTSFLFHWKEESQHAIIDEPGRHLDARRQAGEKSSAKPKRCRFWPGRFDYPGRDAEPSC